jgi:hypothetical protein
MKMYTFDVVLKGAFTVEAASQDEAERIVLGALDDCSTAHIFEHPHDIDHDHPELEGEVSLMGKPTLGMIDGVDVESAP